MGVGGAKAGGCHDASGCKIDTGQLHVVQRLQIWPDWGAEVQTQK